VTDEDIGLDVIREAPADAVDEIVEYVRSSSTLPSKVMLSSHAALSRSMALARTPTIAGVRMSARRRAHGGSTGSMRRICCQQ
jgi:hypothetical protein